MSFNDRWELLELTTANSNPQLQKKKKKEKLNFKKPKLNKK